MKFEYRFSGKVQNKGDDQLKDALSYYHFPHRQVDEGC
jgi:hypothetical protein